VLERIAKRRHHCDICHIISSRTKTFLVPAITRLICPENVDYTQLSSELSIYSGFYSLYFSGFVLLQIVYRGLEVRCTLYITQNPIALMMMMMIMMMMLLMMMSTNLLIIQVSSCLYISYCI